MPYQCIREGHKVSFRAIGFALYELAQLITENIKFSYKKEGERILVDFANNTELKFEKFKNYQLYFDVDDDHLNLVGCDCVSDDSEFQLTSIVPSSASWLTLGIKPVSISSEIKPEKSQQIFTISVTEALNSDDFIVEEKKVFSVAKPEEKPRVEESEESEESEEDSELDDDLRDVYLGKGLLGWKKKSTS